MDQSEEAGIDPFPILLDVLRSGKGHLAWAKYAEDPWWPALSLTGAAWGECIMTRRKRSR